jgi:hypothetical protein
MKRIYFLTRYFLLLHRLDKEAADFNILKINEDKSTH